MSIIRTVTLEIKINRNGGLDNSSIINTYPHKIIIPVNTLVVCIRKANYVEIYWKEGKERKEYKLKNIYLKLLGKIGADKASYVNILTPVVALSLSTIFENYIWGVQNFIGFLLVIIGNFIILSKKLN